MRTLLLIPLLLLQTTHSVYPPDGIEQPPTGVTAHPFQCPCGFSVDPIYNGVTLRTQNFGKIAGNCGSQLTATCTTPESLNLFCGAGAPTNLGYWEANTGANTCEFDTWNPWTGDPYSEGHTGLTATQLQECVNQFVDWGFHVFCNATEYWTMDEPASGSRANLKTTHTFTESGPEPVPAVTGKHSYAAGFTGISLQTLITSNAVNLTGTAFSLSAWVKMDALAGHNSWFLSENAASNPSFAGYLRADGQATFIIRNTVAGISAPTSGSSVDYAGKWRHFCATWTAGEGAKLYIDGALVGTGAVLAGTMNDQDVGVIAGADYGGSYPYGGTGNVGYLDEVGIWQNIDIGQAGCAAIYNKKKGLFYGTAP